MPGVYISYPFCAQKCTYCNFASGVFPRALEARYLETLIAEIDAHQWQWLPETLYVGGGTPSALEPNLFRRLLSALPSTPWVEATLEAAPGTLSAENVGAWRESGINRLSLGVQSFVQEELARTGRRHSAETVSREVRLLRDSGIANFNLDLIAGLPGQTTASWHASLDWIERLSPPHVSVYMFEVDENSRLGLEILQKGSRYGAPGVPSDDLTADLYEAAAERLARMGIYRYEISNFAAPGFESRHNLKYWRREPYIGFGSDAHSFDGSRRWQNVEQPADYVAGQAGCDSATGPDEKFFLGLRLTEGIRPEVEEWRRFEQPISRFIAAGLLETDGPRLRLTPRGILLSNEVFQEFVTS